MDIESKLQEFELLGVEDEGVEIGRGANASVVELKFRKLKCAGKRFYRILYAEYQDKHKKALAQQRWYKECALLSSLRHPNIVQFLGIHSEKHAPPVLVMEFVPFTLSHQIERHGIFPQEISYGILVDVAKALCYLHGGNPLIIHRDLTANNVLLTFEMRAKISDLGTAKILDITPAQKVNMSTCPGTLWYMPPEALTSNPVYRTEIDSFSYGVLILHIFCGRWPIPDEQKKIGDDGKLTACTELERRECYLSKMGHNHPLIELTKRCLSDIPSKRPDATEILTCVEKVAEMHPPKFDCVLTLNREVNSLTEKLEEANSRLSQQEKDYCDQLETVSLCYDERISEERGQNSTEKNQIMQLWTQELEHYKSRNERLSTQLEDANFQRSIDINILTSQVSQLTADISHLSTVLRTEKARNDEQMNSFQTVIDVKNTEYKQSFGELKEKDEELEVKRKEISTLQEMNKATMKELGHKKKELEFKKISEMALEKQVKAMQLQLKVQQEGMDALSKQLETKHCQLSALQWQVKQMTKQTELVQKELELQNRHWATKEANLHEKLTQQNLLLKNKEQLEMLRNSEIAALKENLETKEGIMQGLLQLQQRVRKFLSEKDTPLNNRIQFGFKSLADLPLAMTDVQCTVIENRVYVGGGTAEDKSDHVSQTPIFEYSESSDQWTVLTQNQTRFFGLTSLKGKLVTIGGMCSKHTISKEVNVFDFTTNTWDDNDIPPIAMQRFYPAVISYCSRLAVCGGVTVGGSITNTVEVLIEGQWYKAPSLPHRICLAKPAVFDNMCYLIGGLFSCNPEAPSKAVICIPLSTLFSRQDRSLHGDDKAWEIKLEEESSTIHYRSAVTNFGGMLLALGGWSSALQSTTTDIAAYSSTTNVWVKIGNMPQSRSSFEATAQLQSGHILMFGGLEKTSTTKKISASVHLMSLAF